MHLCTCVSEEGGDWEGAGEGGDAKAVASPLELLSLDTHRREVTTTHGTLPTDMRRKPNVNCANVAIPECSAPAFLRQVVRNLLCNQIPEIIPLGSVIIQ